MRGIQDKGAEELRSFRNRLKRSFGMDRISPEDYDRLNRKINDLLNDVASIQEDDPNRKEF